MSRLKPLGMVDDRIPCPKCGKRNTNEYWSQHWDCDDCGHSWVVTTPAAPAPKLTSESEDPHWDDGGYNPADVTDGDYFRELFGGEDFSNDGPSLSEMDAPKLTDFELAVLQELNQYQPKPDETDGYIATGRVYPRWKEDRQQRNAVRRIGRKGYLDERDPHDVWSVVRINYAGRLALMEAQS